MGLAAWVRVVLIFSAGCHSILLWRLCAEKLWRLYLYFTLFLSAELLQGLILIPFPIQTAGYFYTVLISGPIIWILAYLVVLELYRLILEDYPGISSVGRQAVTWCMGVAVIVSIIYAIPDLRRTTGPFPANRMYGVVERSTILGLLLFLALIQLFLFHYKLRLSPNRMIYATGYAIYFASTIAPDIVVASVGIRVGTDFSLWTSSIGSAILVAGAVMLRKEGEVRVEPQAVDEDSERARLQQQLTEMNRLLIRAARGRG